MSAAIPPGEAEELARLRAIAQRLGIPDDVRLLSPWAPLADGGLAGASGAADLLLRFSPVPVLGVTGSAGKTTTSRLAEAMLRASGIETLASSDAPADNAWPTAGLLERVLAGSPSRVVHRRADLEPSRGLLREPADRLHHERLGRPRRPARQPRRVSRRQAPHRRVSGGR